jgi:hypothetical protein
MRTDRFQYDNALRTAIEKLACAGQASGDRGSREALAAGNARAPEPLSSGQARRVDERKLPHTVYGSSGNRNRHRSATRP